MGQAYRTLWPFIVGGTLIPRGTFVQYVEGTPATDFEGCWIFQIQLDNGRMFGLTVVEDHPHEELILIAKRAGAFEQLVLTPPYTRVSWDHLLQEDSTWGTI